MDKPLEELTPEEANHLGYLHGARGAAYNNPFALGSAQFNEYERAFWQADKLHGPPRRYLPPPMQESWEDMSYRDREMWKKQKQDEVRHLPQKNPYKAAKDGG